MTLFYYKTLLGEVAKRLSNNRQMFCNCRVGKCHGIELTDIGR